MCENRLRRSVLIFVFLLVGACQAVLGCTQQPPQPPPAWVIRTGWIQPYPCGPKYQLVWVLFHNYTTFGATTGRYCACALNLGGPIASIVGARLLDADSGKAIPGFDFCINENVGISSSKILGGGNFQGFITRVSQDVPTGIRCDLMICLLLKKTSTVADLAKHLQTGSIVTGEADENGNFDGSHFGATPAGDVEEGSVQLVNAPPDNDVVTPQKALREEDTEL